MALAEFIVMFRETFEIALVLGIMLAYLYRTKNGKYARFVYAGAALAVLASFASAAAFSLLAGGFEGNEALFEGITLVLACALVTWLILWMFRQGNVERKLEGEMEERIARHAQLGLAAFAFLAVLREGVEMVIFTGGIALSTGALSLAAGAAGAVAAVLLAWAVFRRTVKLDLKAFFLATSAMLVLLAAGLLSQGVHELQEAGVLPVSVEHVYDITPPQNADGSYPLMHEKGAAGGVLKGLFGYDTAPSLEQALAYLGYLLLVLLACLNMGKGRGR